MLNISMYLCTELFVNQNNILKKFSYFLFIKTLVCQVEESWYEKVEHSEMTDFRIRFSQKVLSWTVTIFRLYKMKITQLDSYNVFLYII